MSEMPGISPYVARFARWVRDAGLTVYMPSLFGRDVVMPRVPRTMLTLARTCISREFRAFAANKSSPVTQWLRALTALAHKDCGGHGEGALGMCFTDNFALNMMLEKSVVALGLSQPSLPMHDAAGLAIHPDELARVRQRLEDENLTVRAFRFEDDTFGPAAKFAAYERALGNRFAGAVLPDSTANPDAPLKTPHNVVTLHLIDEAGQPTVQVRDEILDFFRAPLIDGV